MRRIVICYRREDRTAAERLERLIHRGVGEVAVDVIADDQPLPEQQQLDAALRECGLCLVLVTPGWVSRHDARMRPRLEDPLDAVRLVLDGVARWDSPFFIVLDGEAVLPNHEQLPADLRFLRVRGGVFHLVDDRTKIASLVAEVLSRDEYATNFRPSHRLAPMFYPYLPDLDRFPAASGGKVEPAPEPEPSVATQPPPVERPTPAVDALQEEIEQALARRAKAGKRAGEGPAAGTVTESVLLAASAPRLARIGSEFTARLAAYLPGEEKVVREELGRLSPRAVAHMGLKTCQWQRGTEVSVTLKARDLVASPSLQRFVWNEGRQLVEFDVAVPADAEPSTVVLKFDVAIEGVVVARMRLDLELVRRGSIEPAGLGTVDGRAARTAFASYSSADRDRVLDRVAAVRISAGLDVFLDCLSLHPGDEWKPQLEAQIATRDIFLLFWSQHAAESPWVTWEWQTALDRKGTESMQIHPLQADVSPPEALRHLHFGDLYMLARGHRSSS